MNNKKYPTGVAFPISPHNADRIRGGAKIICKNIGPLIRKNAVKNRSISTKICKGMNFFVYETSPIREITCKSIISKIEFLNVEEYIRKFKENKSFATFNDLKEYVSKNPKRKMIVLTLRNIKFNLKNPPILLNSGLGYQYIYD